MIRAFLLSLRIASDREIKTMKHTSIVMAIALACIGTASGQVAGDSNKPKGNTERIGIYDSRAVAYAVFSSGEHQRKINDTMKAANDAKAAGNDERFRELSKSLREHQEQLHLQVFSIAPVDDALAKMTNRVAQVQKEAAVSKLVSKWDEATLKEHQKAEKIDVTDLLLQEFKLTEKQRSVIKDMKTKAPLPLETAKELMRKGEL